MVWKLTNSEFQGPVCLSCNVVSSSLVCLRATSDDMVVVVVLQAFESIYYNLPCFPVLNISLTRGCFRRVNHTEISMLPPTTNDSPDTLATLSQVPSNVETRKVTRAFLPLSTMIETSDRRLDVEPSPQTRINTCLLFSCMRCVTSKRGLFKTSFWLSRGHATR